jgi:hypothetical protein
VDFDRPGWCTSRWTSRAGSRHFLLGPTRWLARLAVQPGYRNGSFRAGCRSRVPSSSSRPRRCPARHARRQSREVELSLRGRTGGLRAKPSPSRDHDRRHQQTALKSATVTRRSWVRRTTVFPGFDTALTCGDVEPMTGIEPAYSAWEACPGAIRPVSLGANRSSGDV